MRIGREWLLAIIAGLCLGGCAGLPADRPHSAQAVPEAIAAASGGGPVRIKIIAINDFHGNIAKPAIPIDEIAADGRPIRVFAGGAAYLASAIDELRAQNPHHLVISAGDMIGASPLISSLYLDEPTIGVMNRIGLDFNAVGNHEFDRGRQELLRMQNGGCQKHTARTPCAVEPSFPGASFGYLAANVLTEDGSTLFPASAIRRFGDGERQVAVGIIGLTLKGTPNLVTPTGIIGLRFEDEADRINALVPELLGQGADAIIVLIHEGIKTNRLTNDTRCEGITNDLPAILARLDPRVDLIVSGHTHRPYVCEWGRQDAARPYLLTSAGLAGAYVTDIDLAIDPASGRVVEKRATNRVVQNDGIQSGHEAIAPLADLPSYPPRADIAAYVGRYQDAVRAAEGRRVARIAAPMARSESGMAESALGNLIADGMLAATQDVALGGAQIAIMNSTGVRQALEPGADGFVTFGQIYTVQPFNNNLVTLTLSGAQLRGLLEQQFDDEGFMQLLSVSQGLRFSYDLRRPAGSRIVGASFRGIPIADRRVYRIVTNNFLASGGDSFTLFKQGRDAVIGPVDLDATEAYLVARQPVASPALDRTRNLSPALPPEPAR